MVTERIPRLQQQVVEDYIAQGYALCLPESPVPPGTPKSCHPYAQRLSDTKHEDGTWSSNWFCPLCNLKFSCHHPDPGVK